MNKKTCFKCGITKETSFFYRHKAMGDGFLGKCKECTKKDAIKNRNDNLDYYQEYDRKRSWLPKRIKQRKIVAERWKKDPKLKKRNSELKAAWSEKNTIKRAAHILTGSAIKSGKLLKQPCEVCGKTKVEAHHDDYSKPLDVRWLCKFHHTEHHKLEREKNRN